MKVLYVISNKIISCAFLCQKAKQSYITLHNNVIKYLKTYFEINCPKTGMKYHQLLNDNAPAHEASILSIRKRKMKMSYHTTGYPYLSPFDIFDDTNLKKPLISNLSITGGCPKGVVLKMFL